jgi:hypothetical protein
MHNVLTKEEFLQFRQEGFVIKNVLERGDVERYGESVGARMAQRSDAAPKMCNIQFLQPAHAIRGIHSIIKHSPILEVCRDVLDGGGMILDGASLFYAEQGVDYRQGWHRDVMQMPDDDILDSWFSPTHFHNSVQVNIPLRADSCLWLVKGSHARQFTEYEKMLFHGSKKLAPVDDRQEPFGDQILLQPGQAIFYNNLAIHRGYGGVLAEERMTVQLGYHSTRAAPTCHFGVLDFREYTHEYLESLEDDVRQMLSEHIAQRLAWQNSDIYFERHREFVENSFQVK